jgi:RNA polymerase sigma-70 factor (ECF subfamily)
MTMTPTIGCSSSIALSPRAASDAFRAQLVSHHGMLADLALFLTRDRAAADDLLQDTVERALRAARQFKAGTNMRAWLGRIMRNHFMDGCRHSMRVRALRADQVAAPEQDAPAAPSRLDLISMADVLDALRGMDAFHRDIFALAYIERMPYRGIARRLHIPVSTVGTRLWRAKAKLRRRLESRWFQAEGVAQSNDA